MEGYLEEIIKKDFDLEFFTGKVQEDKKMREFIIDNLLENKNIMVYYHCYYILDRGSRERPGLFYKYWEEFYSLLAYKNSYHREIGLTLLGNIVGEDRQNLFKEIKDEYFSHVDDEKFMTADSCMKNINRICKYKKEYIEEVSKIYLNIDRTSRFKEKQIELIKFNIIDFFEEYYQFISDKTGILEFVNLARESLSPKTRKKARNSYLLK